MTIHKCSCCSSEFDSSHFSDEDRKVIARSYKEQPGLRLINEMRSLSKLGLREAKIVLIHITPWGGHCHKCRDPLPGKGDVNCGKCGALNFDWLDEVIEPPPLPAYMQRLNAMHMVDCPWCEFPLGEGVTKCWQKGCGSSPFYTY